MDAASQTPEMRRKRLAMGIIEYLDKAIAQDIVSSDGAESLEVAKQCIADAFEIDPADESQSKELSIKPISLDKVFDVYLTTQAKVAPPPSGGAAEPSDKAEAVSEKDEKRAEELKAEGNKLILQKDYKGAVSLYTQAIELNPGSSVYYGNRAAAYSQAGEHEKAVADAKKALEIDPSYSKGYSRLGLAYYGMQKYADAADAYMKGLELDPSNSFMKNSLEAAKSKLQVEMDDDEEPSDRSAPGAAGSGAGGMDLGSLLNNPALMNMAQNMMANGGLERMMNNPAIAEMANSYRSSGQMPNMADMMNNPEIRNLASQFNGGSGNPSTGSAGSESTGANPLASLMNNPDLMNMARQFMGGNNNTGGNSN